MIEIINQHTLRINHIIEDILKISRGSPTAQDSIDLASWLPKFIDDYCQSGFAEPGYFELEIELDMPGIQFDPGHLTQILTNLCTNARLHGNAEKSVKIKVYANQNYQLCLEVADQGPGIEADNLDKIFEPFYTTSHQGSGLGLYIVSQLCELNNATISASINRYNGSSLILQMGTPWIRAE